MAEEPKDRQEEMQEDRQFIQEKIVPKRKNKIKKRLGTVVFVVLMAIVFGLVSQFVFLTSGDLLKEWLGIEEGRQTFNWNPTPVPKETMTPAPTPTMALKETLTPAPTVTNTPIPTPTKKPTPKEEITTPPEPSEGAVETKIPEETPVLIPGADITEGPEVTPVLTPGADLTVAPEETPVITPVATQSAEETKTPEETPVLTPGEDAAEQPEATPTPDISYLQMYQEIMKVAAEAAPALVTVETIVESVDWFQEVYVIRMRTPGLILGNDGVDLLILTDITRVAGASAVDVYFGETAVSGRIYSVGKAYGLAIVAVPLAKLSPELLDSICYSRIAPAEDIVVGTPVIALGAPNGYENSMEFGMITSLGSTISVTDGQVSYFTTNITDYADGYGFVVNLDGEVLGMMTHTLKKNQGDGIFTVLSLDVISSVIEALLNNRSIGYFGIKGLDLPKNVVEISGLTTGVYVSEVENASPALNAGMKAGDVIIAVNGTEISGIRAFTEVLLEHTGREPMQVTIMRRTENAMKEIRLEVTLTTER